MHSFPRHNTPVILFTFFLYFNYKSCHFYFIISSCLSLAQAAEVRIKENYSNPHRRCFCRYHYCNIDYLLRNSPSTAAPRYTLPLRVHYCHTSTKPTYLIISIKKTGPVTYALPLYSSSWLSSAAFTVRK